MKRIQYIFSILSFLMFINCSEDKIDGDRIGSISGKVVENNTNSPLENVKISTNPTSNTVFSDENGEFVLDNVKINEYSVQAELEGYVTAFESAIVLENEVANVVLELKFSNANNQAPSTPNLVFPEDGAEEIDLEIEFNWESSDVDINDELNYILELRNATTNAIEVFETAQDTFKIVSGLQLSTNYFWQVKVSDGVNDQVSSSISQFKTITAPNNPFLLVKKINGNSVIFSGNETNEDGATDIDLLQLTTESTNSFRPRANLETNKIAYLRTVDGNANLFTMNFDGTDKTQITNTIPVAGFRADELDFCWGQNGGKLYFPHFSNLYSVDPDGGSIELIYQTTDGSLISEIAVSEFDNDLFVIKTNNLNGYQVRIFTYRLSTSTEETVIIENELGAFGGLDITADGNRVLYTHDVSNSENLNYRKLQSRIFIHNLLDSTTTTLDTETNVGENDLDPKFSPSEGLIIFTRILNSVGSIPRIISFQFGASTQEKELFTAASMPDWN